MPDPTEAQIAQIQEAAIERLIFGARPPRVVVAYLVETFPDIPAGTVMFELVCIAHEFQARYAGRTEETWRLGCDLYQAIGLLAADIHGVQTMTGALPLCRELRAFWGAQDGFFRYDDA